MTNSKLSFLVQRWGVSVSSRLMNEQKKRRVTIGLDLGD